MRYEWGKHEALLRDGVQVGSAAKSFWRERATVTADAGTWSFQAEGHRRILVADADGAERVGAVCSGWFSPTWTVDGEAARYRVRRAGVFTNRLVVDRDGVTIGTLTSVSWASERPVLDVDADVPLADAVLLLWVGYVARQREAAAASAGSTAAT